MKKLIILITIVSIGSAAAQQPIPFTEWRASLETDLSKLSMPRDAHAAIFNILQAYERQAQNAKIRTDTAVPGAGPYGVPHITPPDDLPKN